jgi:cobalt/nickel transport system permease protein
MKESETGPYQGAASVAKKKSFVQKTIYGALDFFQKSLISEEFAKRNGLLQRLDPRVKLISGLVLIVAVSLSRDARVLFIVYLFTLLLAYLSRIEVLFFIKRVWVFIPIFAGVIVLPMLFNVFLPGDRLVTLVTLGNGTHLGPILLPSSIYITRQGTIYVTTFMLRVATCVSLTVLLFLTTQRDLLFKSLRTLHVPKVYILTLNMCYRYIFLLLDLVTGFFKARKSRQIRNLSLREDQRWLGSRVGYILIKSLDMSNRVQDAMISRGFDGDVKLLHAYAMHRRDYAAITIALTLSSILALISQNIIRI